MESPSVGLVGVGLIGRAIADMLLAAGVPLVVHDRNPTALEGLPAVAVVADAAALAARSDVVLLAVQTDEQCAAVLADALPSCRPGAVVVVHSTVQPSTVCELAARAAEHGVRLLDAPVAGNGSEGIRDRSMWVLAGGDTAVVDELRPLFAHYSGRVLHTGDTGSGSALKLAHNVFVYLGYEAVRESVELARAAGVADGLLAEVTTASQMLSPAFRVYHDIYERRRLLAGPGTDRKVDPDGGVFDTYAAVLDKDVRQALALAAEHDVTLPGVELLQGKGPEMYCA